MHEPPSPRALAMHCAKLSKPHQPGPEKPLVATPAAIAMYTHEAILACLGVLRKKAYQHGGLDYLQVFVDSEKAENLWFIEDGPGGAITALLPSDY